MKQIDTVSTGKLMRLVLKQAFPKTKFSVRLNSYSGGHSYTARWSDGPTSKQVSAITDRFQTTHFDGMNDSTSYSHQRIINGELVEINGGYVFATRDITPYTRAFVTESLAKQCGISVDSHQHARVPFQFHPSWQDGPISAHDVASILASDIHQGEYFSTLVDRVCSVLSYESTSTLMAGLPEYVRSWKADVIADNSGEFVSNSLRFETQEQARKYAIDLAGRWLSVREWKVSPSTDAVTVTLTQVA